MSRFDNDDYNGGASMGRQRDLVLATNEFCFLK